MKRLVPVFFVVLTVACGSNPNAPSAPPANNPPAPTRFSLAGGVTETAPTTSEKVTTATVTITSGPDAGQSQPVDGAGNFRFSNLQAGSVTLRASAPGYQDGTASVTLNQDMSGVMVRATPEARQITETLTGAVSGGDAACPGSSTSSKPCSRHSFGVHNDGGIVARIAWSGSADLDLELWRDGVKVASSTSASSASELVSVTGTPGSRYEVRVVYYSGATIANYTLILVRPS